MAEQKSIKLSAEARRIISDLQTMPQWMLKAVAGAMARENQFTVSHIQREYLSFPKDGPTVEIGLRVQSNRLRGSVWASEPVIGEGRVESAIGSNVEYAAIHEFGGRTSPHVIEAKDGGVLAFQIGERTVFAKRVNHPGSEMPARAPFQRGINDRLNDYSESISAAIAAAWEQNKTN